MNDLHDRILRYGDLSPEEQADVEHRALGHPGAAALLAEAKALHGLLVAARAHTADLPDAEVLAEYVVMRHFPGGAAPEAGPRAARVEAALRAHPDLAAQVRAMEETLARLLQGREHPVAHFERLSGRSLAELPLPSTRRAPDAPATARTAARLRLLAFTRYAVAACFALGLFYGGLAFTSGLSVSERARLAGLGELAGAYGGFHLRGASESAPMEQYALALEQIEASRRSTFGLFPHYDAAALDAAAARLSAVARAPEAPAWLVLEARYALGKVRLHQGRDAEAATAFQAVVDQQGPSAPDARRLLDWLQANQGR